MLNIQSDKYRNNLLLDDHTFRRIEKFTGEAGTWPEWSFGLSVTAATVEHGIGASLDEIKKRASAPLTSNTIRGLDPDGNPINPGGWGDWFPGIGEKYTQALFNILVLLTKGEANAVVRNVTSKTPGGLKCGF